MKAKKNEKLRLEKNSSLYFLIGLTLLLALTYLALEWKTYHKSFAFDPEIDVQALIDELPPVTIQKLPPPPPPKIEAIQEIEVKENEEDFIETIIETNNGDDDEILEISGFHFEKPPIDEEIIFIKVEDKPIFPGCENASDKYTCFQEMMKLHIKKNFRYPETAIDIGAEGRVSVMFTIQKDGSIGDVKMRGPHKILEEEADRIISKLPKMTPGKQRGKPVKVPFSIPITFRLH